MFAMRNGIIADTLRSAGSPFQIIFGLNLPQLVEIANTNGPSKELAQKLWANTTTRESMLLAPMLMPIDDFCIEEARQWAAEAQVEEVADILCHRLLRHMPYAWQLAEELSDKYIGLRLAYNLAHTDPLRAKLIAEKSLTNPSLAPLATRLVEDCGYLL